MLSGSAPVAAAAGRGVTQPARLVLPGRYSSNFPARGGLQHLRVAAPWDAEAGDEKAREPTFTKEEAATLSADQLAFLERKRRGIMPRGSVCVTCEGEGAVVCRACGGTGINSHKADEEMFDGEIKQNNGLLDTRTFFLKDCPCWLCRGKQQISCADCEGAGFRGVSENFGGD